ncbi:MAG: ATP synthase F1 subunit delta [Oscillospiraceae bacterium]|jgi:F-type H+-transporting ATPase subunit delta|nr:ATP synthase F1 subunit delta [Oscillospiraceae bacterium]
MANSVENVYSSALLELLEEQHGNNKAGFAEALSELGAVNDVFDAAPEIFGFSLVPTVSREDKISVIKNVFADKVSPFTLNFLCVLTEKKRLPRFGNIYRDFRGKYYEKFGIAPVTVTSAFALSAEQKQKITAKMAQITGKEVELSEKTDKSVIGGIVVDYGSSRLDGSVKNRLDSLRKEIADTVL